MKCVHCLIEQPDSNFLYDKHNKRMHKRCKSCHNTKLLSEDKYEDLFLKQKGVCAICSKTNTPNRSNGKLQKLSVDHNHTTGEVRGLLCRECNMGLGKFKDSVYLLGKAIEYLNP